MGATSLLNVGPPAGGAAADWARSVAAPRAQTVTAARTVRVMAYEDSSVEGTVGAPVWYGPARPGSRALSVMHAPPAEAAWQADAVSSRVPISARPSAE